IPSYWADQPTGLGTTNGVIWFRKNFKVSSSMVGKVAELRLGCIVDADSAFINGVYVGNITYQYPPRIYKVPAGLLKEGENTITVRVISNTGNGGFVPDKFYRITTNTDTIDLKGIWHFKLGTDMPALAAQTFFQWKPAGLYNGMIAPLENYAVKGVIWYQGESNTENPSEYRQSFPALIKLWRTKWNNPTMPFLYVQLANFMQAHNMPAESNWAELRNVQRETLSLPNTGMAVAIDIGEWNDIHPLNKKEVGYRLALWARKIAYNDKRVIASGPLYQSMTVKGNKVMLSFSDVGSGLKPVEKLKGFAIADTDGKFVWAYATIENNKVVVWSDEVANPVEVRYAWSNNPEEANLYNKEGLPASPFTTKKHKK
ncbi:MAG: beta galactosidase jelly roll domain-containing protein, partial [Bacteroidales bacterium]|nr:beta galactosidase jelly roll domain-containing protein [Bacteroidales bacterium]